MKILLSCVPFDGGKSGISVYVRELVAALRAQGHSLTLIVEADAADSFPDYDRIILPKVCGRAVVSMLYEVHSLWSEDDLSGSFSHN